MVYIKSNKLKKNTYTTIQNAFTFQQTSSNKNFLWFYKNKNHCINEQTKKKTHTQLYKCLYISTICFFLQTKTTVYIKTKKLKKHTQL